jgi:flavoprotein
MGRRNVILSDEERAARRRDVHRRYRAKHSVKVKATAHAYKVAHRKEIAAWVRAWQQRAHAAGQCINCNKPHAHISQKTRKLALRCFGCANIQNVAQRARMAAKRAAKVAA